MKFATVFGASEVSADEEEYRTAVQLGEFLARRGYCVKCGGYFGLMEAVAKGVQSVDGARCIGITVRSFDPKPGNSFISEEQKEDTLFDRLRALISDSELIVAQPGSLGTLLEVLCVWCLAYTQILKDVRICLIGNSWRDALEGLRVMPIKSDLFSLVECYPSLAAFMQSFDDA